MLLSRVSFCAAVLTCRCFHPTSGAVSALADLGKGRIYGEPHGVLTRGCRSSKPALLPALLMFTYFISPLHICLQLDSADAVICSAEGACVLLLPWAGLRMRYRLQLLVSLQQTLPALAVPSKIIMPEALDINGKFMALKERLNITECRKIIHKSALYECLLHVLSWFHCCLLPWTLFPVYPWCQGISYKASSNCKFIAVVSDLP